MNFFLKISKQLGKNIFMSSGGDGGGGDNFNTSRKILQFDTHKFFQKLRAKFQCFFFFT